MKKVKLTLVGKYVACSLSLAILVAALVAVNISFDDSESKEVDYNYVNKVVTEEEMPVINSSSVIVRPYLDTNVKILKNFYDYKGEKEQQENSILYYESTYIPNYAIAYGGVEKFEVISILDGTVISIKEDDLLGKIIEIQHENDLISVYQSVNDITVKENQTVKQGEVIASSGVSNLNKDLNNHLLFELLHKGQIVNPEKYYNKDIKNL